jgi:hypothetical protein
MLRSMSKWVDRIAGDLALLKLPKSEYLDSPRQSFGRQTKSCRNRGRLVFSARPDSLKWLRPMN